MWPVAPETPVVSMPNSPLKTAVPEPETWLAAGASVTTNCRRDPAASGPMQSLRGYRARAGRGIAFGIYLEPLTTGVTVHVGDRVEPMLA